MTSQPAERGLLAGSAPSCCPLPASGLPWPLRGSSLACQAIMKAGSLVECAPYGILLGNLSPTDPPGPDTLLLLQKPAEDRGGAQWALKAEKVGAEFASVCGFSQLSSLLWSLVFLPEKWEDKQKGRVGI